MTESESTCSSETWISLIIPNANDGRGLKVVVDGLRLGGCQLAIDTTVVGALQDVWLVRGSIA